MQIPFQIYDLQIFSPILWIVFLLSSRCPLKHKSFIYVFIFLAMPHGLQDLGSPTRDRTRATAVKAPSPKHWTAREVPKSLNCDGIIFFFFYHLCFWCHS